MKNILSYKEGTEFTGREIKDFINYHLSNLESSHYKDAYSMKRFLTLKDTRKYRIFKDTDRDSSSYGTYRAIKVESSKRNKQ